MKFENRKQKVSPFSHFLYRLGRYSLFAFGLVAISVLIGTIGYHFLGNIVWLDSFHMACMILTGMGPVNVLQTQGAKIFASFYALYSGVAFLTIVGVFFAPVIHRFLHQIQAVDTSGSVEKSDKRWIPPPVR